MDEDELAQTFDLDRSELVLDVEGSAAELRQRWDQAIGAHADRAGLLRAASAALGLVLVIEGALFCAVVAAELDGSFAELLRGALPVDIELGPQLYVPLLIAIVVVGAALRVVDRRLARRVPAAELDPRKLSLVEALVAYFERELRPVETLTLHVELRPALRGGYPEVDDGRFDFGELARPDTEPEVHDWLRLSTTIGGRELNLRARSLVGSMGRERRIRDEIGVEISAAGVDLERASFDEAQLRTRLRDHEHRSGRARFLFRGAAAGRRLELEPEPTLTGRTDPREPPQYEYADLDWLLSDGALVDHIEYVRRVTKP